MVRLEYIIPEARKGKEIANYLKLDLNFSTLMRKMLRDSPHSLLLDGIPVPSYTIPQPGQILTICLPEDPPSPITPTAGKLDILYEDPHLLIVNKPGNLIVHPGPEHHSDTLGNLVTYHYKEQGEDHLFRPVNRLDKGTSGLMCIAKHAYAAQQLSEQLHTPDFRRVYLAVCEGIPNPMVGTIHLPIGRKEGSVVERCISPTGKDAVTEYRILSYFQDRSLAEITLKTGRTHQIRVHFSAIDHPLMGDFLYGTEDHSLISRPALHSARLSLLHPVTGVSLSFEAPLPSDMARLLR